MSLPKINYSSHLLSHGYLHFSLVNRVSRLTDPLDRIAKFHIDAHDPLC